MDFFFRAADHRFKDADLRERPSEPGQHLVRALLMAIQLLPVGILMRWPLREHCSRAWRTLVHIEIPADDEVS